MIVLVKNVGSNDLIFRQVQPIVILDYTRSDEQWTKAEIAAAVKATARGIVRALPPIVYSLDYKMSYTHTGIAYGDSIKTTFTATISNPPLDLVSLLNISQFTSQENIEALKRTVNSIIDPQIVFPQGKFFIKSPLTDPTQVRTPETISRPFIIYSTPFNFDQTRTNSTLTLRGAAFDSMVMRLQFAVNLDKAKPLAGQIEAALRSRDITPVFPPEFDGVFPAVSRYYAPAPLDDILGEICLDNKISFSNDTEGFIRFVSLNPDDPPPDNIVNRFTFRNSVPGSKCIASFSLSNYTTCEFEAEATEIRLFNSVAVHDDSDSPGLFGNLTKIPTKSNTVQLPSIGSFSITGKNAEKYPGYRFYVQEYTYIDSRDRTSVRITGSNNWITSSFKIDSILENAIYKNAANGLGV